MHDVIACGACGGSGKDITTLDGDCEFCDGTGDICVGLLDDIEDTWSDLEESWEGDRDG